MRRFDRPFALLSVLALLLPLLTGCTLPFQEPTPTPPPTATPTLPPVDVVAQAFLDAWQEGDYLGMYDLLSYSAQDTYSEGTLG